jgi:hypothetical protein
MRHRREEAPDFVTVDDLAARAQTERRPSAGIRSPGT